MMPLDRLPVLILSGLFVFSSSASGQQKTQPIPGGSAAGFSSIKITENADARRLIDAGRACIKDEDWNKAIQTLQTLLDEKQDSCIRVIERDFADPQQEITRWASVKREANHLIGSMPPKGLQAYELAYGDQAKKLLDDAKKKNDTELFAEVAQRFRHTKAGREAHEIVTKLFQPTKDAEVIVKDWPSWRGNATNTGQANGSAPVLANQLWTRPIFMDKVEGFEIKDEDQKALAHVNTAIKQVNDLSQSVLPGFFPVATRDIMVYRSQRDIRAVSLKDLEIKDADGTISRVKRGQILWKTLQLSRSLSILLEGNRTRAKTESWIAAYQQAPGYTSFLYDNTVVGALSTDHRLVYAIDDLAVPPLPTMFQAGAWNNPQLNPQELKPLLMSNELHAYELMSGKRIWDIGADMPEFKDSHFLGQPISIGGKLYVLNEKLVNFEQNVKKPGFLPNQFGGESELRLICIDPTKVNNGQPAIVAPVQVLGKVAQQDRMVQDVRRRVNTVQLATSGGILVCPTNAGEVFGIDLRTRSLAWSYPYRESAIAPLVLPGMPLPPFPFQPKGNLGTSVISKWKSAPPAIQAGKVVFTAPDADSIHCVRLDDGKRVWKKRHQKGDLYMAGVFDGRVLIVGDKSLRALDLKNGSQLWSIPTGDLPSGQGAVSKMIYYLPLKNEVLAVDIVKGEIKAHHRVPAGGTAPGNLVFYENMVLSQTPLEVTAYPQLSARLKDAKRAADTDEGNLAQGRITLSDIKGLRDPLLLQDSECVYVALNQPIDAAKVGGGRVLPNFNNSTRCLPVNGWFVAIHRHDGKKKAGPREITWKKGDLAWHSYTPLQNQLIVVEQFAESPIVLFTARYIEFLNTSTSRWVASTQSVQKSNGKFLYDSGPHPINFAPMYTDLQIDQKTRTVNLIGLGGSVQHYVNDGKGPPRP